MESYIHRIYFCHSEEIGLLIYDSFLFLVYEEIRKL